MSQSEEEFHRKIAKECFNKTWDYLDKKGRDAYDDRQMLHLAHASRYHWSFLGDAGNLAVGEWQISRAYVVLNQPDLALSFAQSALEGMEKNNLTEILHTGYEGMARAYALAKDYQRARDYIKKAREQLDKATGLDAEDKKIYSDQIDEVDRLTKQ